jgi:hypothetical protein
VGVISWRSEAPGWADCERGGVSIGALEEREEVKFKPPLKVDWEAAARDSGARLGVVREDS